MSNKTEILKILRENKGSYVSGQKLCDMLKVSRTAVWKYMSQLKEEGYMISSVSHKGYTLEEEPKEDILSQWEITSHLKTKCFGQRTEYYPETDSTNLRIKQLGEEGALEGTLAVADCQTAGRGRRGRSWASEPGSGIWMTLLLRPECAPAQVSSITLVAAIAVAKGLQAQTGLEVQIKWPNDIVCGGKKLCGILTEMSTEVDYINYVAVGIGINVHMKQFPKELEKTATSLYLETGKTFSRSLIIADIMAYMEKYYERFLQDGDFSGLMEEYDALLVNRDRQVSVLTGDIHHQRVLFQGKALGVNEKGALLVEDEQKEIHEVVAGEVSVRGVYGYV